ncbi:hypothetical protein [Candidatus Williamhamiltonella defendens]|uniref:hypothetical protein n=1 Tax=Candidatus Williamhamiltonella defendens TaxID=138072 RepID=UPI001F1B005F|nr:hypothetical protein [Candidatus Hamiltonella defensa]
MICEIDANSEGNQSITAYIYEANVPLNFISTDADDGKSDLAAGCGSGTKKILPIHEES